MKRPLSIFGEWALLTRTHARERNLDSLRKIREWLDCVENYLEAGGDPGGDPRLTNFKPTNARGVTDSKFDSVPMATLCFWLCWWERPERTWCGAEEAGRDPAVEAAALRREIAAREALHD